MGTGRARGRSGRRRSGEGTHSAECRTSVSYSVVGMMSGTISGLSPRIHELRESVLESAEDRPGTYRMVGADGEHLYVGKSVRIRTRLLSYFRAADERSEEHTSELQSRGQFVSRHLPEEKKI